MNARKIFSMSISVDVGSQSLHGCKIILQRYLPFHELFHGIFYFVYNLKLLYNILNCIYSPFPLK